MEKQCLIYEVSLPATFFWKEWRQAETFQSNWPSVASETNQQNQ
jgi:hypothetical protein